MFVSLPSSSIIHEKYMTRQIRIEQGTLTEWSVKLRSLLWGRSQTTVPADGRFVWSYSETEKWSL